MDENECLVGELRKYLSTAKYQTQDHESEQVQSLKRDLNLAARVGQQLLMQLQSAEKSRAAAEKELLSLKQKNTRLADENHHLACEHELMTESISQQEVEIKSLMLRLKEAQSKTERLRRATSAAKALEREVQMLEHVQLQLRTELEQRTQQREDAQKLAKHLASSLAQHVASDFGDLKREIWLNNDVPSLTQDTTESTRNDDTRNEDRTHPTSGDLRPNTSVDSIESELDLSIANLSIMPRDTATPLKKKKPRRRSTDGWRQPPQLVRSKSHESVLSIIPTPPPVVSSTSKLETTALPKAVTALSDEHSLAQGHSSESVAPVRSARDKLSQMRGIPSTTTNSDRRRWAFTPFRALH